MPTRIPTTRELADGHGRAWVNDLAAAARAHLAEAERLQAAYPDPLASQARQITTHINEASSLTALHEENRLELPLNVDNTLPGDPFAPRRSGDHRDDDRRAADTRVAALVRDGLMSSAGAETITRLCERGSIGDRTLATRWAAATSDVDYINAFAKVVVDSQQGHLMFTPEEGRAFQRAQEVRGWLESTPASAGYLVPSLLDPAVLLSNVGVNSPMRRVARVETLTQAQGDRWRGLTSAGSSAEWKAEGVAANPVTPTVAVPDIPVYTVSAFTKFSLEIAQDGLRLVENLTEILTDAANQKMENAYATGSGVAEPQGIVTGLALVAASVIAPTTPEVYGKLDPIKLQNDLGPRFQPNASFLMALATINATAVFETTAGALLYADVSRGSLLRRPLHEMSTLDSTYDAAVVQAHNFLVIYGDIQKAYVIADKIGAGLEVIPHIFNSSGNPTGERGAWLHLRTGGGVIMPEAARVLDIPTS